MKKIVLLILCLILMSTLSFAELPLRIEVDGGKMEFPDAQPFIDEHSRTQIPARFIAEELGVTVGWDEKTMEAIFTKDLQKLIFTIGSDIYSYNGTLMKMDTAAVIYEQRTYVPVRYIAEAFGAEVTWDQKTSTVGINRNKGVEVINPVGETFYEGVGFDPGRDLDSYGRMIEDKTIEFSLKMIKHIKFSTIDGQLYMEGKETDLPPGFHWRFTMAINPTDEHGLTRRYSNEAHKEDRLLEPNPYFKELSFVQDPADIEILEVLLKLQNELNYNTGDLYVKEGYKDGHYGNIARFQNKRDSPDISEQIDFDSIFMWK